MIDYQGAYPHLRLAREYDVPYDCVLAAAMWQTNKIEANDHRYDEALVRWFRWSNAHPQVSGKVSHRLTLAHQHFEQQKRGLRDMRGNWYPERNGSQ